MATEYKRKKMWVDGAFQARLLLRLGVYLLLYAAIALHVGFLMQLISQTVRSGVHQSALELYQDFMSQQRYLIYALIVLAPYMAWDMVKFSNRIAGPLLRCRRVMLEMAEGKPVSEFVPRRRDLMREFWPAFNALIRAWNVRRATSEPAGDKRSAQRPLTQTAAHK